MNLEQWFATPIWYEYTDLDVATIRQKCLDLRENNYPNRVFSNAGGWQTVDLKLNEFSEFQPLEELIRQKIENVSAQIHPDFKCELDNVWLNINDKGNYNRPHYHPSATLSGCVYISADEQSGNIVFHDHTLRGHYPFKNVGSSLFNDDVNYKPKNGLIIIFPAWVEHQVQISDSNEPRISFAFNVKQIT